MLEGARKLGIRVDYKRSLEYRGKPEHDAAIFYGFSDGLRRIFDDYRKTTRRAVYVDLGYWGRRKRTRHDGYHKIAINDRHPTAYFQLRKHPGDRFHQFDIPIRPWRKKSRHVLVAGMSAKAAAAEGFGAEEWERRAIARLRELTDRPIVYRPKPNWPHASLIAGSALQRGVPIEEALNNCHAVVTHHSNVAVDGLLAGIPCICEAGVASVLGSRSLEDIENPPMPDGREQWAADLAYTQWNMDEMRAGRAWRYLLDEELI